MGITLTPELEQSIEQLAQQEQRAPLQIIEDAIALYRKGQKPILGTDFLLAIAGQGRSAEDDVSERDEDILAAESDPHQGWKPRISTDDPA